MWKLGAALISCIVAVGAIDGPTGHELDNWGLCFSAMGAAIFFGIWGIISVDSQDC